MGVSRSYAPGFIFTPSLSPVLVAGALASGRHLKASSVERDGQQTAAATLKTMMRDAGLPVMGSATHIVPLMVGDPVKAKKISDRSEEHTSELQSLMRISYAVFCLKKKKQHTKTIHQDRHKQCEHHIPNPKRI